MDIINEFIARSGLFDTALVRLQSTRCTQGAVADLQAWTCDCRSTERNDLDKGNMTTS